MAFALTAVPTATTWTSVLPFVKKLAPTISVIGLLVAVRNARKQQVIRIISAKQKVRTYILSYLSSLH